ncbi:hypothetical protein AKJ52_02665 [candidate division MSBL1 archaeon SCGC-AAA382C18]|uniref:DUF6989 domain-containing protein n=1 Tax=candidate division MSBL1 archaeon SCGC-AAA382C18 TaxID=1698281 RepID=A0A133VHV4_9EURY|nr:hypothetical protein AKJ52_02665 [candidate division MSBL1 archaeon SCGC-AAA382C18]
MDFRKALSKTDFHVALLIGIHISSAVFYSLFSLKYDILILILLFQFLIIYLNRGKKPEMLKLAVIGITAGYVELIADFFLVSIGSLKYNPIEMFIWKSPLYMPFIWNFVIFEIGYIAVRLDEKIGRIKSAILTGLLAVLFVGGMEVLASDQNMWWYEKAALATFNQVPMYILLGEGLMFAILIFVVVDKKIITFSRLILNVNHSDNTLYKKLLKSMDKGMIFGLIILLFYIVSYYLLRLFTFLT